MKVCNLYGAGYYYIPGTDTCIKIGGFVRYEMFHNTNASFQNFEGVTTQSAFSRHTDTFIQRTRAVLSADVRSQTEYGTLRSYLLMGFQTVSGGQGGAGAILPTPSAFTRYYIQFAGFTVGLTDTYFDIYNGAAYGYNANLGSSNIGPPGINVAAYTAQFGNGVSASIALEDHQTRDKAIVDLNGSATGALTSATLFPGFAPSTTDTAGTRHPDIVGNIRVDQAWGSAQIMGALHENRARQYSGPIAGTTCVAGNLNQNGCGAPGDEWGWAVGAGLTLKMPWNSKDTLSFQVAYTEGAIAYATQNGNTLTLHKSGGFAVAPFTNAVFTNPAGATAGNLELTEAWSIVAAFEHWWTPTLRTSFWGYYLELDYNQPATTAICGAIGAGGGLFTAAPGFSGTCNPDSKFWLLASRTQWNPVANLDVGLEVAYSKIEPGILGSANLAPGNGLATGRYALTDQDVWHATFRVQRNFWP